MDSKYDQKQWERETNIGRRLFIHNFGMRGDELPGWNLIKIAVMENEPGAAEKIYMWKKKKSEEEELVQVSVVESGYWRHSQQHLANQLHHCMRADMPRGKGKTGRVGDVQYIGQAPESGEVTAVFFTRGNLQVNVRSVGRKPVDVLELAQRLDNRFVKPPSKIDLKKERVRTLEPRAVTAKKDKKAILLERLPEAVPRSGWTKVIAPEGEVRRYGDRLCLIAEKDGRKDVEILNFTLE